MISRKTIKIISLAAAMTTAGGLVQTGTVIPSAYAAEAEDADSSITMDDNNEVTEGSDDAAEAESKDNIKEEHKQAFIDAEDKLNEKLNESINKDSSKEDVEGILDKFSYTSTSGAAVTIKARNISDFNNDGNLCSFNADIYNEKNESETRGIHYPKTYETVEGQVQIYNAEAPEVNVWQGGTINSGIDKPEDNSVFAIGNVNFKLNGDEVELYGLEEGVSENISGSIKIPSAIKFNNEHKEYKVTSIYNEMFSDCNNLTSITIPNSIESIGDNAFKNCTSLKSITIPASVKSIGDSAFLYCNSLKAIGVSETNTNYESGDGILFSKGKKKIIAYPAGKDSENYEIPASVKSIGSSAFQGCTGLTSITIPNSVTSIGDGAFQGCTRLESITIPDSVTSIGACVFWECTSLTSITIPDNVTSIGYCAFYRCTSLESITIPDSVESIGYGAFQVCTGFTSITIPDSVESIGECAFYGCTGLESITIPDSVESIGYGAFQGCTVLKSITIPDSVTSIGDGAFCNCSSEAKFIVAKSIKDLFSIGNYCESENSIIILGLNLNEKSKEINTNCGEVEFEYTTEGEEDQTVTVQQAKIISGNDNNIAEVSTDSDNKKVKVTATGKGNGTVKVKISAQEKIDGETYTVDKIVTVKISKNADRSSLQSKYDECKDIVNNNYTDDSWAAFSEALSNAGNVLGSKTSSDEEIQTAYDNLQTAAGALKTKSSSGGSSSSHHHSSSSSANSNSIISVNGNSVKPVILSKETYGNTVVGNNLTGVGLTAAHITSLYEINDDGFKGNVANLSSTEKNADGTESTYNYVYVKCDSVDSSKTIKINVSAFKDNAPAYVYKTDELGNITLVKAVDAAALAVNKDCIEISPEAGVKYIVTDKKLEEKNTVQNKASDALKEGWNKIGSSWMFIKNGQAVTGWAKDTDGKWYYMSSDGIMQTGWVKDNEKWYNLSNSGAMNIGWLKDVDGKWYMLSNSGAMVTGWFEDTDGKWYYLREDGSMAAGTTVNGYEVGNDGAWIE